MTPPPAEPVHRRALKNTVASGMLLVSSILVSLVAAPIYLREWGPSRYGAWLSVLAALTLLRTLDAGHISFVGNELNVFYHRDRERMRLALASSLRVSLMLSLLELGVWAGFLGLGRLGTLTGLSDSQMHEYGVAPALGVLLLASALTGPHLGVIHRLYMPVGLLHEGSWWAVLQQFGLAAALIASALFKVSIVTAAIGYGAIQGVTAIASALYLRWRAPDLSPWWRGGSWRMAFRDFGHSIFLTLNSLGQQASGSGAVLFVSARLGVASVPVFTTVRSLSNLWTAVASVFAAPVLPEVVRFHGLRETGKILTAFRAHWYFGGVLVNASMLAALPVIEFFFRRWTRGTIPFDRALFTNLIATVSLANFGLGLSTYLSGINNLVSQLVTSALRAALMLGVALALVAPLGLNAVGLAFWLGEGACSVALLLYFTQRELRGLEARLAGRDIAAALLLTLPVQLLAVDSTFRLGFHWGAWCIAASSLLVLSAWQWRGLDPDVKSRALLLLRMRARS